jgi:hypothetical protein
MKVFLQANRGAGEKRLTLRVAWRRSGVQFPRPGGEWRVEVVNEGVELEETKGSGLSAALCVWAWLTRRAARGEEEAGGTPEIVFFIPFPLGGERGEGS